MEDRHLELQLIADLIKDNHRLAIIIEKLIDRLLPPPLPPTAASLTAIYLTSHNTNTMAQTINVLAGQTTVTGQLTPLAADGVTVEPITTINAGSEVYTLTPTGIATVAPVSGGPEGQFAVTVVSGQTGTVVLTYTAVTTAGLTITNLNGVGDTFVFQGATTGVAASLTAVYNPAA